MVNVLRNSHHAQFPLTDNLMSLVFLVKAGMNENQRERFVTSIMAQYTYLQVKQLCMELFCTTRTGCERWKQPIRKPSDNALANCIPLVYMTLPPLEQTTSEAVFQTLPCPLSPDLHSVAARLPATCCQLPASLGVGAQDRYSRRPHLRLARIFSGIHED